MLVLNEILLSEKNISKKNTNGKEPYYGILVFS